MWMFFPERTVKTNTNFNKDENNDSHFNPPCGVTRGFGSQCTENVPRDVQPVVQFLLSDLDGPIRQRRIKQLIEAGTLPTLGWLLANFGVEVQLGLQEQWFRFLVLFEKLSHTSGERRLVGLQALSEISHQIGRLLLEMIQFE